MYFFVSETCHPQTIAVVQTRAEPLGIEVVVGDHAKFTLNEKVFGVLLQYPATDGAILDYEPFIREVHKHKALAVVATDLLALTLLKPPGEFGADVAVGSAQRFGVPMGYGGPHAAFFATRDAYKRHMPGRLVGVSKDAKATRPCGLRSRRANNTFAARKPRAISAPRKCCWPSWPRCTRCITGQEG
jgi:glycine dehydrogenase